MYLGRTDSCRQSKKDGCPSPPSKRFQPLSRSVGLLPSPFPSSQCKLSLAALTPSFRSTDQLIIHSICIPTSVTSQVLRGIEGFAPLFSSLINKLKPRLDQEGKSFSFYLLMPLGAMHSSTAATMYVHSHSKQELENLLCGEGIHLPTFPCPILPGPAFHFQQQQVQFENK